MTESRLATTAARELASGVSFLDSLPNAPKVTFFGSARIDPAGPLGTMVTDIAAQLASRGWLGISGAGGGVMTAAAVGSGPAKAVGVDIVLAGESLTAAIDSERRLADTTLFFTRKVLLTRSSHAFIVAPGGIGTQDELFELINLLITKKSSPVPVVLVDVPGGAYWSSWRSFVEANLVDPGYLESDGLSMIAECTDAASAVAVVENFYRNVASVTFDGDDLLVQVRFPVDASARQHLERRGFKCSWTNETTVRVTVPPRHYGLVTAFLDAINELVA